MVERYDYEDYGRSHVLDPGGTPVTPGTLGEAESAVGNPFRYTGRRFDPETGLTWYRTRYYDPRAGRFTSRDTIGIWGDPGNLGNGFTYVGNNPWSRIDPFGETWWGWDGLLLYMQNAAGSGPSPPADEPGAGSGDGGGDPSGGGSGPSGPGTEAGEGPVPPQPAAEPGGGGAPPHVFGIPHAVLVIFFAAQDEHMRQIIEEQYRREQMRELAEIPGIVGDYLEAILEALINIGLINVPEPTDIATIGAMGMVGRYGDDLVDLSTPSRRRHILDGDGNRRGGHRPGQGIPGKSEFPEGWSDDEIMHHISDVATDPTSSRRAGRGGRTIVEGNRHGIDIRVVLESDGSIVTGFPTKVQRNPR